MAEQQQGIVERLTDAIWTASALVSALGKQVLDPEDLAAEVLAQAALVERTETGWEPTAALSQEIPAERAELVRQRLISALGCSATIAAHGPDGDWDRYSDDVLLAQGRLSAAAAGNFVGRFVQSDPELGNAFAAGGVVIDVGVGVAAAACSICDALPGARVIGIDINARALALAQQVVAANGLGERVELRLQGVEALRDSGVASLAHLPVPFIPRKVLGDGLARLHAALNPGGVLVLSGIAKPGPDGAIGGWQTYNAGGTTATLAECDELVRAAGFESIKAWPMPPGVPQVGFCRA